ncbi:MAG: cupin domain-containing protein [Kiritimatiellaceae bacterium]|nr:cupin domain-containing protein [Kiritimatiellaceae bacterium]
MKTSNHWINELALEPHLEGGWYRRVYESDLMMDGRPALTSIYYLLEGCEFSALHRLKSDEQWHFYAGAPITIHEINAAGIYFATTLGEGCFQHTVRAENLFGATVDGDYALVGCSVVPGFDFFDFEMPPRSQCLEEFPQHAELIQRLTRIV